MKRKFFLTSSNKEGSEQLVKLIVDQERILAELL